MAKILLIEDETAVLEMLVDELTVQGHDVTDAPNGIEGLKRFLEAAPDIVLCDRDMPGMSGYELLKRIRTEHPEHDNIPFVYLTALTDPRDKASVEHLKPSAYIEKPIDFTVLSQKIDDLLRR